MKQKEFHFHMQINYEASEFAAFKTYRRRSLVSSEDRAQSPQCVYRAQASPDDNCKLLEKFLIFVSLFKTVFPPLNDVKRPLED